MAQVLRITFNNTDYNYQILNTTAVSKETQEIQILIEDTTQTLVRSGNQWLPKETDPAIVPGLVAAIGRALGLRYRI
jgi:hypothetical protein